MKVILSFLILFSISVSSQITGPLLDSGRKLSADFDFQITGHKTGILVFNIAVDPEGVVKLCEYDKLKSTLISTPLMVKAKNHILINLKFEKGYHFPELQSGQVTIEVVME